MTLEDYLASADHPIPDEEEERDIKFGHALGLLGSRGSLEPEWQIDTFSSSQRLDAFEDYLAACGVHYFPGREVAAAHKPFIANALGYGPWLLPHVRLWSRAAVLGLLADQLRRAAGAAVRCRNWWRPHDYNLRVGGAAASDHVDACAFDLDFGSRLQRGRAQKVVEHYYSVGMFDMSLGVGARTIHVGVFSPGGHRRWKY